MGETEFAGGEWFGIELKDTIGKNDGSVNGHRYFTCGDNTGLFVRREAILRAIPEVSPNKPRKLSATSAFFTAVATSTLVDRLHDIGVGDRVECSGKGPGVVRYVGRVNFSGGPWFGVELDSAAGKNDGSVSGVKYFSCPSGHGIFVRRARLAPASMSDDAPSPLEDGPNQIRQSLI